MKLRKLRSLRGGAATSAQQQQQQQQQQQGLNGNKNTVLADLESIRGVFNEKEKELSMAVRKVEELTHQLEDLRTGRVSSHYPPQIVELERLRRELAYRKQLAEQQNQMIAQQRAQLAVGRDEISRIDSRVMELQERLERKRMMNQQLANQVCFNLFLKTRDEFKKYLDV
jgi:apoptosis-stimulating of p53 protein 1